MTYVTSNVDYETPAGRLKVVDLSSFNWLYVLFNTIEEAVRADQRGRITNSLAKEIKWINSTTLQVHLREGVIFHNNEPFNADVVQKAFEEVKPWIAPHPPGTWLNLPEETTLEKLDSYTVRFHFSKPDGLAIGKLRAHHYPNQAFWKELGFGYKKFGSGEGHW
jgi:ABC-type transport system substrate-binding protein